MLAIIGPSGSQSLQKGIGALTTLKIGYDWTFPSCPRVPVIPVLVGGVPRPKRSDLPDDLKPLIEHQVATITTNGFRNEMAGLARDIRDLLGDEPRRWPYLAGAAVIGLALGAFLSEGARSCREPRLAKHGKSKKGFA